MLGHFTNDMFGGVLTILLPVMKDRFELTNAEVGLVPLAYTGMASLTQPVFGYFTDRFGRRWFASVTLLWGATFVGLYGFAPSYPLFLTFAGLAGLSSGAFHPIGASGAALVARDHYRNAAMSLYTVGGTSGLSLGPLVAVALLAMFGPPGTALLLAPAIVVAGLLLPQMALVEGARRSIAAEATDGDAPPPAWGLLRRVMVVTMLRSWAFFSVSQFVPLWYDDMGYSRAFYGSLVTAIVLAGAVGTLTGGALADRIGQRRVVVGSLLLAIPSLALLAGLPGPLAILSGILFGLTADASLSITLVMAQRLVPGRIGVTTGVILGLGFVTGGIGVPITGRIADAVGYSAALMSLCLVLAAAALLALRIPMEHPIATATSAVDQTVRTAPTTPVLKGQR